MTKMRLVVLMFDDVEVLDFAGPFEVFGVANELNQNSLLEIQLVSVDGMAVVAKNGLSINVDAAIDEISAADLLLVPGGAGTRTVIEQTKTIQWIAERAAAATHTMSVCSGALLLAKAGLLSQCKVTTHHHCFELLQGLAPDAKICHQSRFVDNGQLITSAGISAGIDMSLHMVARLFGPLAAKATADYMEYAWQAEAM
ncbi:DJ-1/PfpI family protein [Corallincola holothuriorum]|uniref:DJ-1/PfpI family protein n=1 Tax=Corallincola holothuriorum TaxID=2282215 RepID=A0A368NR48_9GAMM|nr:DJ-1/PfpI family protein [Corallincola holothuriorum]RCU52878.1 DJ-1/PfpI family protein [Corallincola holothuriorum]